ncbi:hypothetical protein NDK43_20705 [Neobacillus pocheonensis]|uniref:Uncharacterized protein n=1 Tax=Neobacillus pocheonensis TaxID=363869 RepID=A0ABT0WDD6_9BACI|nr:hypothetical protein [Neobacillus pocheonensis]
MTLPRELSIRNCKLIQQPVKELQALRKQQHEIKDVFHQEKKMYDAFTGHHSK